MENLHFSAAHPIEGNRQVVPAESFPRDIKLSPPSHQIRISPEKSEFDAKGIPLWCSIHPFYPLPFDCAEGYFDN